MNITTHIWIIESAAEGQIDVFDYDAQFEHRIGAIRFGRAHPLKTALEARPLVEALIKAYKEQPVQEDKAP